MPNLYIYAFLGLIILALLGGGYWYFEKSQAEKAILIEKNAQLSTTVLIQENTIKNMKSTAERIIKSNTELTNDLIKAEENSAQEKETITSDNTSGLNEEEIEKKINEDFIRSNRNLESVY